MEPLKTTFLALALLWAVPASADPLDRWTPYIAEASARFDIPAAWIREVMRAESGGRTTLNGRRIVSSAGAMGLMQLMPATWRAMRARLGLGPDPHDPRDNILAGTAYLRKMYDRFGYPGLFAAYNAGPGRYAAHLATGRRLPRETKAYLAHVIASDAPGSAPTRRPVSAKLFVLRAAIGPGANTERIAPPSAATDLFFPVRGTPAP